MEKDSSRLENQGRHLFPYFSTTSSSLLVVNIKQLSNFDANGQHIRNSVILYRFLTSSTISTGPEKERIFSNVQKQYTMQAPPPELPGHMVASRKRANEISF
jgi:hypothetical protein